MDVDNHRPKNEFKPHQVPNTERTLSRLKFVKENVFPDLRIEDFIGKESQWNIYPKGNI